MKLQKIRRFILLFLGLSLLSCDNESEAKKEYEQKFAEVLAIHDEVMPKMGELNQLSLDLEQRVDTISNNTQQYEEARADLENAYDFMMEWMHGFSDDYVKNQPALQELSEEEIIEKNRGLQKEIEKVNEMKAAVNSSMENARALLNE